MDTTKDTTMQHVTDAVIAEIKRAAEHPLQAPVIVRAAVMLGILARIEQLESDLATAEQDSRQKQARIERLEEEECKQAALLDCLNEWKALAKSAEKERDALRAKITEMEKQAPTHWSCNVLQADASWKEEVGREIPPDGYYSIRDIKPLYALPGAQAQGEEK